jgi:stage V sporulation protein SpoVS
VEVLKVSSKSNPNSCAGALAGVLRQSGAVEVQVVGAGALNQAIKAVAIARGFVADSGLDRRQPVTLDMRTDPATIVTGNGHTELADVRPVPEVTPPAG